MLRVLKSDWHEGLAPEDKAAIQAQNADPSKPLATWGYDHLVQVGVPPMVALVKMSDAQYKGLKALVADAPADTLQFLQAISTLITQSTSPVQECEPR